MNPTKKHLDFEDVVDFINSTYSKTVANTYGCAIKQFNIDGVDFATLLNKPLLVANKLKTNGMGKDRLRALFKALKSALNKMMEIDDLKQRIGTIDKTTLNSYNNYIIKQIYKDDIIINKPQIIEDQCLYTHDSFSGSDEDSRDSIVEIIQTNETMQETKSHRIIALERQIFELEKKNEALEKKNEALENDIDILSKSFAIFAKRL